MKESQQRRLDLADVELRSSGFGGVPWGHPTDKGLVLVLHGPPHMGILLCVRSDNITARIEYPTYNAFESLVSILYQRRRRTWLADLQRQDVKAEATGVISKSRVAVVALALKSVLAFPSSSSWEISGTFSNGYG
ncbi:hypothetical protein N7535_001450 [Penicillium sp. DV-2018c]|nr:hypothetical protein N7535_001450 [Penicillium sp. DV-2018c]